MTRIEQGVITLVTVVVVVAFFGVGVLFGIAQIHPYRPRTITGWVLFFSAPILILPSLALIARLIEAEPLGRWLTASGKHEGRWAARIYLLIRTIIVLGTLLVTAYLVVTHTPGIQAFVARHFGPDA